MKYSELFTSIQKLSSIPTEEWLRLEEIATIKNIPKNGMILNQGDIALELGLVISGSIRMYYLDDEGREFNHAFMFEGSLFAGYPSLLFKEPSTFCIRAMEDTTYLSIPYEVFLPFFDRHPCWDRMARKALEVKYIHKLQREAILLTGDTLSKYQRALLLYPHLAKRIPQYHLASYLGVTSSALNRVLNK